ncbi:hypothetical protein SEA_BERKA_8 [Arthrobacter phage Berka]|nr:hypothetical protein SEA_BERKA_8 [Arthrobacter phage Berka]
MYIKGIRDLLKAKTTAAALTAIGARGGADPATATIAELRVGSQTATRLISPQLLKDYVSASGTTAARPTDATVGFEYFDTTLGKPVWLKTAPSAWVDSAGVTA